MFSQVPIVLITVSVKTKAKYPTAPYQFSEGLFVSKAIGEQIDYLMHYYLLNIEGARRENNYPGGVRHRN